jgi:hypothetical protein
MARKVRIGVSVFFGVLAVALCVLWVRSYLVRDYVQFSARGAVHVHSSCGMIEYSWLASRPKAWEYSTFPPHDYGDWKLHNLWRTGRTYQHALVPFALVVGTTIVATLLPWSGAVRQFSLRTLFITTSIIAILLGLAVWAGR